MLHPRPIWNEQLRPFTEHDRVLLQGGSADSGCTPPPPSELAGPFRRGDLCPSPTLPAACLSVRSVAHILLSPLHQAANTPCDLLLNSQGSRGTAEELNNCHPTADFMAPLTLFVLDFCQSHPTQSEPRHCAPRPTFAPTPALTGSQ